MDKLTAIPTEYGLNLLAGDLKSTASQYSLVGHATYDSDSPVKFYQEQIETSYFDDNGILTFVVNLPTEIDFEKYLYQINILDESNNIIIQVETPKVYLGIGIGGMVTIKAAVKGEAGEIVFKAHDYITEPEMIDLWMNPIYANSAAIIQNATRQIKLHNKLVELEKN